MRCERMMGARRKEPCAGDATRSRPAEQSVLFLERRGSSISRLQIVRLGWDWNDS